MAWRGFGARGSKFQARPVIVTPDLSMIEKDTILVAAKQRGISPEIPGKFDAQMRPKKVPLVRLAEMVGINGIYFRSRKEGARYVELRRLEDAGHIRELSRQPRFKLHCVNPSGLKVCIAEYTADYHYFERLDPAMAAVRLFDEQPGESEIWEEVKGHAGTANAMKDWELRRKWVEAEYGIKIRVT